MIHSEVTQVGHLPRRNLPPKGLRSDPNFVPFSCRSQLTPSYFLPNLHQPQILRSQPENIYTFGASYFEGKMLDNAKEHERRARGTVDGGSGGTDDEQMTQEMEDQKEKPGLLDMSDAELAEFVTAQFARYDVDGDGFLDLGEFKLLLSDAELGLSKKEMRAVMQEADANDDGVLEYTEFVPVMVRAFPNHHTPPLRLPIRDVNHFLVHLFRWRSFTVYRRVRSPRRPLRLTRSTQENRSPCTCYTAFHVTSWRK